jgi:hypothetical protein
MLEAGRERTFLETEGMRATDQHRDLDRRRNVRDRRAD